MLFRKEGQTPTPDDVSTAAGEFFLSYLVTAKLYYGPFSIGSWGRPLAWCSSPPDPCPPQGKALGNHQPLLRSESIGDPWVGAGVERIRVRQASRMATAWPYSTAGIDDTTPHESMLVLGSANIRPAPASRLHAAQGSF